MSADGVHEIVIIKRVSGGHEDEHHGGVWKIAFADFMTAMMAFFLVMWLISANDKTKATIARYFNPVQLVDSTPQPRGLEDPKPGAPSVMPRSGSATTDPKAKDSKDSKEAKDAKPAAAQPPKAASEADAAGKTAKDDENNLFRDPYAVLAELAAKDKVPPTGPVSKSPTEGKVGGSGAIGVKGGDAYRDPFDPAAAAEVSRDVTAGDPAATENPAAAEAAADQAEAAAPSPAPTSAKSAASSAAKDPPKPNAADAAPATSLSALRAEVQAIVKSDGALAGHGPAIEVHQTQEGLLVDVTDGTDFAMFGNASARPSPKTVVVMEKIGRLLKAQPGQIVLRGFTDNRPFKSDTYDNWRLSAARADMAHYMLVRGGIDERRFDRIEGYADRRPKDANDPASPVNRRIQILIRGPNP